MGFDQLPTAIIVTLVCVVIVLGFWYLGIQRGSQKLKQIGVMIGIFPMLVMALILAVPWLEGVPEYRTVAQGPLSREAATATSVMIPVTDPELTQEIELTAKIHGENPPTQPILLKFQVLSPVGEILKQGEQEAPPTQTLQWVPIRISFETREAGEHLLKLEIPQPATRVDVVARELRK
jgi:hypothetical protein